MTLVEAAPTRSPMAARTRTRPSTIIPAWVT
jgi:hypothetical protein